MIRLKAFLESVFMFCVLTAHAQNIDSLFVQVPQAELPLLETNARLDMLDLYNYKMLAKGENVFGGNSVMLKKTANHVLVKLSDVSRWEMVRVTFGNTFRYVCIHSLTEGVPYSQCHVYGVDWENVDDVILPKPATELFWVCNDSVSEEQQSRLKFLLADAHVMWHWEDEKENVPPVLVATLVLPNLDEDMKNATRKCLRSIAYKWNGSAFEKCGL